MTDRSRDPWRSKEMRALFEAIQGLESTTEVAAFLRDLCTVAELEAMAHRWQVAGLVDAGLPYLEVAARAGASTTTVTRVAHSLRYGQDGYRRALDRRAATPAPTRNQATSQASEPTARRTARASS